MVAKGGIMKVFINAGCGKCIVLKQVREFVLIASLGKEEFIVATYLSEDGSWSWGQYFTDIDSALAHFNKRVGDENGR